ncbi:MAG: hypothetical protein RIS14_1151, partial [Pseudomonadota bacterium]
DFLTDIGREVSELPASLFEMRPRKPG